MKKLSFLLLFAIIFISGCITSSTQYQNDVIVLSQYVLTRNNPYAGSTTSIRFYLQNMGDKTVPKADVDFFDLNGLTVNSINCQGGSQINDHSCEYTNIPTFDSRYFAITLNTPSVDFIKSQTTFTISYKISFDYSGFARLLIPVIDSMQEMQPHNKYSISSPSVGPIAVNFDPPLGATSVQNGQQVQEYWGVKGDTVDIRMNFKQAVQSNVPTNISAGNIQMSLQGLSIDTNSQCDFNSGGTAKLDITVSQDQTPLSCSLTAQSFSGAEKMTAVDVSYSYNFATIKSETITVYPRTTSSVTTSSSGGSGSNSGVGTGNGGTAV